MYQSCCVVDVCGLPARSPQLSSNQECHQLAHWESTLRSVIVGFSLRVFACVYVMGERVHQLPLPCMRVGEGPHWLEDEQALLVVDMPAKTLRKHNVETGRNQFLHIDGGTDGQAVSMAVPVEGTDDLWIVGLGNTLAAVRWAASDPDSHTVTPTILHITQDHHFNDAKCDPRGRLWIGTMSDMKNLVPFNPQSCHLFKYDHNLDLTTWAKDVTISNGMAWSNSKKDFYYVDSYTGCIYHFDYDDEKGAISGQRVLLDFKEAGLKDQFPDGITIDHDDNLWVACFSGSQVVCIDPRRGEVVRQVGVPAKSVTSVCWGGKDYTTLYVTSATLMTEQQSAAHSSAGGTFAITGLGVKGNPPVSFKPDLTKLREKMEK